MATRKPLVYRDDLGHVGSPTPGDTIDPIYLPASTGSAVPTRIPTGTNYTIPADTQAIKAINIVVEAGSFIVIGSNSYLVGIS